jgi:hypothetical protein
MRLIKDNANIGKEIGCNEILKGSNAVSGISSIQHKFHLFQEGPIVLKRQARKEG